MNDDYHPRWRIEPGLGRHLGIGIIGCGGIVRGAHLPAYRAAGLNVVAVFDIDEEKARTTARDFSISVVARSAEELANRADVDIVDIAVLPWVQPEIVPVVAAAGKHMLCQKPLAMDYATGVAEVEAAEAAGVLLAVNHQMRWDAGIAAARDLVAQGALGTVTEAQIQVSVSTPLHLWAWIAESPHLDIKIHSTHYLDALRSILGDPEWVTSVHGRYPEQAPVIGETVTKTILEFADGVQGLVATNHYNQHGAPYAEFRLLGTEGTLEGTIGLMYDYPNGRPDTLSLYRAGTEAQAFAFDTLWLPDAFLGPMSDLMDAIATGRTPITAGRQMLPTLAIGEAAYLSAAERRSVRLSEITGSDA
ncbi:MAG TPA: Gfo/Idh/MocA family oxidoreductase [Candidatus Limnocylindrales bacterium]|nr:Gfo/Idh/MocA family oxidoreductase [Candidatus Limnocylindrales bacterium]